MVSTGLTYIDFSDWVTQDLVGQIQSNAVLGAGLRDPECTSAMQLMQQDPELARKRFEGNAKVTRFLQEFGRVMAAHFEALGTQQQAQPQQQQQGVAAIQEIGPLQAQALNRAKATPSGSSSSGSSKPSTGSVVQQRAAIPPPAPPAGDEEAQRVQKVRSDIPVILCYHGASLCYKLCIACNPSGCGTVLCITFS